MDDARSPFTADAAEIVHVVEQRVDERARGVAGAGMHHHSSRLVQNREIRVLVQDVEIQRFRRDRRWSCRGNLNLDPISTMDDGVRLDGDRPAYADAAVRDQPLKLRSRVVGKHRDQHAIEPLTIGVGGDLELERHGAVRLCGHTAPLPVLIGFDGGAARQPGQHDQAERREHD